METQKKLLRKEAGFTLIEVIVTLVMVGIMSTVTGMGIVTGMEGYALARENAAISQKAQLALTRITRELKELIDIQTASSTLIEYNESSKIEFINDTVKINDSTLIDKIESFKIAYYKFDEYGNKLDEYGNMIQWVLGDDIMELTTIKIELTISHKNSEKAITFTETINPRNT